MRWLIKTWKLWNLYWWPLISGLSLDWRGEWFMDYSSFLLRMIRRVWIAYRHHSRQICGEDLCMSTEQSSCVRIIWSFEILYFRCATVVCVYMEIWYCSGRFGLCCTSNIVLLMTRLLPFLGVSLCLPFKSKTKWGFRWSLFFVIINSVCNSSIHWIKV